MGLKLQSTERFFDLYIQEFQADEQISPVESVKIRKSADLEMDTLLDNLKVHLNDVLKKEQKPDLEWPLKRLQAMCDLMVEDLQYLAKVVRKANLDEDTLTSIRSAVEHQLTYVVLGHNASLNRVKAARKAF